MRVWARLLVVAIGLLLAVPGASQAAPTTTDDLKRDEVVKLRVGEQRDFSFAQLVRFSVKDTTVLIVRRIEGDRVTVEAIGAGDTWIEIVHGQRSFTATRVVVEPAAAPSGTASATPVPAPSGQASAAPSPSPGANERALTLEENDLQVGVEVDYGVDTQHFPTLVTFLDGNGEAVVATVDTRVKRQYQVVPISIDWSPSRQDRLTAVFPFVNTDQWVSSPLGSSHDAGSGLGDISLSWEHTFHRRAVGGWETGVQLSTTFPTGRSVYDISRAGELPVGVGHYQVGAGIVVRRVADPLAVFGTLGANYIVARDFHGTRVAPGLGWNASTGISWAMSDRWALSEQLSYTRRPNVFLASPTLTVIQNVDQAYITHGLSYSDRRGQFLVRFLFSAGLNDASTDFSGGVSAQWRR